MFLVLAVVVSVVVASVPLASRFDARAATKSVATFASFDLGTGTILVQITPVLYSVFTGCQFAGGVACSGNATIKTQSGFAFACGDANMPLQLADLYNAMSSAILLTRTAAAFVPSPTSGVGCFATSFAAGTGTATAVVCVDKTGLPTLAAVQDSAWVNVTIAASIQDLGSKTFMDTITKHC